MPRARRSFVAAPRARGAHFGGCSRFGATMTPNVRHPLRGSHGLCPRPYLPRPRSLFDADAIEQGVVAAPVLAHLHLEIQEDLRAEVALELLPRRGADLAHHPP